MREDSAAGSDISVTFSVTLRPGGPRGAEVSVAGSDGQTPSLPEQCRHLYGRGCSASENPAPDGRGWAHERETPRAPATRPAWHGLGFATSVRSSEWAGGQRFLVRWVVSIRNRAGADPEGRESITGNAQTLTPCMTPTVTPFSTPQPPNREGVPVIS